MCGKKFGVSKYYEFRTETSGAGKCCVPFGSDAIFFVRCCVVCHEGVVAYDAGRLYCLDGFLRQILTFYFFLPELPLMMVC